MQVLGFAFYFSEASLRLVSLANSANSLIYFEQAFYRLQMWINSEHISSDNAIWYLMLKSNIGNYINNNKKEERRRKKEREERSIAL